MKKKYQAPAMEIYKTQATLLQVHSAKSNAVKLGGEGHANDVARSREYKSWDDEEDF